MAATERRRRTQVWLLLAPLVVVGAAESSAAVLPEDRSDVMYHYYEGGGVEINGPALLVRKGFAERVSLSASYYADSISSASPDVLSSASKFKDKRDEYGLGLDYLYRNTLIGVGFTTSSENDYEADTLNLGVSHEMFGGMTTVNLGYARGNDVVMRVDNEFRDDISRHNFRLGVSQVLSPSLLVSVDFENITDEGYLNNPYRSARVLGASLPEVYPRTRTSQALSVKLRKSWRYGSTGWLAAVYADYRFFRDTWDIKAHTAEIGVEQYFGRRWTLDWHYRYYSQDKATFYSDNFDNRYTYMARDKELSTFSDHTLGVKLAYMIVDRRGRSARPLRLSLNAGFDRMQFDYVDYTDFRTGAPYSFDAGVAQLFLSLWY